MLSFLYIISRCTRVSESPIWFLRWFLVGSGRCESKMDSSSQQKLRGHLSYSASKRFNKAIEIDGLLMTFEMQLYTPCVHKSWQAVSIAATSPISSPTPLGLSNSHSLERWSAPNARRSSRRQSWPPPAWSTRMTCIMVRHRRPSVAARQIKPRESLR